MFAIIDIGRKTEMAMRNNKNKSKEKNNVKRVSINRTQNEGETVGERKGCNDN